MGSKTKLVTTSIKDNEVKEDNLNTGAVTTAKFVADSVESSEINDGTVTADDLATNLDLSSKTLTLPTSSFNSQNFNISLLGFKMAVNENLSISAGRFEVDMGAGTVDEESTGFSASYTVGSTTIGFVANSTDNVAGTAGSDDSYREIAVSFAF